MCCYTFYELIFPNSCIVFVYLTQANWPYDCTARQAIRAPDKVCRVGDKQTENICVRLYTTAYAGWMRS